MTGALRLPSPAPGPNLEACWPGCGTGGALAGVAAGQAGAGSTVVAVVTG
jgi:hypothetical protein